MSWSEWLNWFEWFELMLLRILQWMIELIEWLRLRWAILLIWSAFQNDWQKLWLQFIQFIEFDSGLPTTQTASIPPPTQSQQTPSYFHNWSASLLHRQLMDLLLLSNHSINNRKCERRSQRDVTIFTIYCLDSWRMSSYQIHVARRQFLLLSHRLVLIPNCE